MPIVIVSGIPDDKQDRLWNLHNAIQEVVLAIPELELKYKRQVKVEFPEDKLNRTGLNEEINVKLILFETSARTSEVINHTSAAIGSEIHTRYPNACIDVRTFPLDLTRGRWHSSQ